MRQLMFSRLRRRRITAAVAAVVVKREMAMPLAVSKDVQDELLAIRADLETAMLKFIRDRHYGAAERMLVIVDRSLHNLIRDAAIMAPSAEGVAARFEWRRDLDDVTTDGVERRIRSAVKNQAGRRPVNE
jgi:hypothetical protein